jgi:hypothetical protein
LGALLRGAHIGKAEEAIPGTLTNTIHTNRHLVNPLKHAGVDDAKA